MEIKEESGLMFGFPEGSKVIKFDDTEFYRKSFNILPDSKGVDFIALEKNRISFIEVKNCTGDEGNCRWRISPNNQKKETSHTSLDIEGRDSLDIELPQKVEMIMSELQRSMRSKLRWFNCKVSVVDSSTYDDRIFQLIPE